MLQLNIRDNCLIERPRRLKLQLRSRISSCTVPKQFLLNSFWRMYSIFRMLQVVRFLDESHSHPKYLFEEPLEFSPVRASRGSGIEFAALTSSERALIRHSRWTSGFAPFPSEFFEPEPKPFSPVPNRLLLLLRCVRGEGPARALVRRNHTEKLEISAAIQPEAPLLRAPRLAAP